MEPFLKQNLMFHLGILTRIIFSSSQDLRYSPVTTSQTHALPRISTRGYTQKAAVCHA